MGSVIRGCWHGRRIGTMQKAPPASCWGQEQHENHDKLEIDISAIQVEQTWRKPHHKNNDNLLINNDITSSPPYIKYPSSDRDHNYKTRPMKSISHLVASIYSEPSLITEE